MLYKVPGCKFIANSRSQIKSICSGVIGTVARRSVFTRMVLEEGPVQRNHQDKLSHYLDESDYI